MHQGSSELKRAGLRVVPSLPSLVIPPYPSLLVGELGLLRALPVLRWVRWPPLLSIVVECVAPVADALVTHRRRVVRSVRSCPCRPCRRLAASASFSFDHPVVAISCHHLVSCCGAGHYLPRVVLSPLTTARSGRLTSSTPSGLGCSASCHSVAHHYLSQLS